MSRSPSVDFWKAAAMDLIRSDVEMPSCESPATAYREIGVAAVAAALADLLCAASCEAADAVRAAA